MQYPKIWSWASFSFTLFAFFPITNAISTSWSNFSAPFGIITLSLGPTIECTDLLKRTGLTGGSAPVSFACSV